MPEILLIISVILFLIILCIRLAGQYYMFNKLLNVPINRRIQPIDLTETVTQSEIVLNS